jgi:hypothetical protein
MTNEMMEDVVSEETPKDDPREKTDWPSNKQTDQPWKGVPEKEQFDPKRPKPDIDKWNETNTK